MTNRSGDKGARGEREVQELLRALGIKKARRMLGAGRKDDVADIDGVRFTAIQVAWRENVTATIRAKTVEVEQQRVNRRVPFACSFIKWNRGPGWIVVMTPAQWYKMWKYAVIGYEVERDRRRAVTLNAAAGKISGHGTHRSTDGPPTDRERGRDRTRARPREGVKQRPGDGGTNRRRVRDT